jgi:histidinol-phosphatase (PHP family)
MKPLGYNKDSNMVLPKRMDYHLHTAVTIDGNMHEMEACERALVLGIQEIAFTNHVMLNQPDHLISPTAFTRHWESIQGYQEQYPGLRILLGIEMDYYPGREDEISDKIRFYEALIGRPFDLILGAIHDINGGFFSNRAVAVDFFKNRDLVATYREYYELAACAVRSQLFDIMAHPDLIKKYTHQLTPFVPLESYKDAIEVYIAELVACGVGIEINTKGMKLPVREAYPSNQFLELYLARVRDSGSDPLITIGSDAHKAMNIGYGFSEVYQLLQHYNVSNLVSFDKREKSPFSI